MWCILVGIDAFVHFHIRIEFGNFSMWCTKSAGKIQSFSAQRTVGGHLCLVQWTENDNDSIEFVLLSRLKVIWTYRFPDELSKCCVFFLLAVTNSLEPGGDIGEFDTGAFSRLESLLASGTFSFLMNVRSFLWFADCGPIWRRWTNSDQSNRYCSSFLLPFNLFEMVFCEIKFYAQWIETIWLNLSYLLEMADG